MVVGRGVEEPGEVAEEAEGDDGDAAVFGGGESLAVEVDGVVGVGGRVAPAEGAAGPVVGDFGGELAEGEVAAVEESRVRQGTGGADGGGLVAVVCEDGGDSERRVGRVRVDVDGQEADVGRRRG